MAVKIAQFRFYEELNDFLPKAKKKITFSYRFQGQPSVKDIIESLGVPHTEIDLILVNDTSVTFEYTLEHGDRVAVYPVFESFDISSVTRLRPKPLREPKFILDVNLGKCARLLRLLGFDSLYSNTYDDREVVEHSGRDNRIILTRDIGLLKIKDVTHGYWVRSTIPRQQIKEVVERFDLCSHISPFTRCMECNGPISKTSKDEIIAELLPKTRRFYNEFCRCSSCNKIYWKGSHYQKMLSFIKTICQ